jgi:hypothetical protein
MFAAQETEGRQQRRHRSDFRRLTDQATNGSRDATLIAEVQFLELWASWHDGDDGAEGRAERFIERHASSGELALLAWILRGEIAFEHERWDDAATAFRFVLGQLGHPLYAYALYRTSHTWQQAGRPEDAREALEEVAQLGCSSDADEPTLRVALQAARDLGQGDRAGPDGVRRPASCSATPASSSMATEDERPPPLE